MLWFVQAVTKAVVYLRRQQQRPELIQAIKQLKAEVAAFDKEAKEIQERHFQQ